jgi:GT2 family glycosyltransferase
VTAVLVSHDGERWLGAVLDGLAGQTRPVDRVVAVDTGSTDGGLRLLRERLGDDAVLPVPAALGFGEAVVRALADLPPAPTEDWVWLLHDDSAPAPDALEQLLAVAAAQPSADILGPKLREWPSLRRLLEVGVTISGTGARETGLESGEYDQGQHDQVKDVLAVNTAGMLVRRSVFESSTRGCRSSATTSTSAGGRPGRGTARSSSRMRSSSTSRRPAAESVVRR